MNSLIIHAAASALVFVPVGSSGESVQPQPVPAVAPRPVAVLPANEELQRRLATEFARLASEGFTGIIRVDARGQTVLRESVGYADPTTRRKFEPDTPVLINSLTKPFTAAAILKLQEQGKLSTQDPLSKFFPAAPDDKSGITLHQLLTHSSGLPLDLGASDLEPVNRAVFIERAFATPLLHPIGSKLEYSNVGYGLLAAVIELVSERDYETIIAQEVLHPAGFTRIGYRRVGGEQRWARTAEGASIEECCWGAGGPYWNLLGNGGFVADPDELVEWRKALASGRILSAASLQAMMTGWVAEGPGNAEGYGWVIAESPEFGRVELAGGGNPFFRTGLRYYRDHELLIHVSTRPPNSPGEVSSRLIRTAFHEAGQD